MSHFDMSSVDMLLFNTNVKIKNGNKGSNTAQNSSKRYV